ncbi:hypothetical protein RA19_24740 [Leisingera sp. ANG-M1]|nr:hypothetical protein RA19_24740 [Leisingera sp. ANG-M1]
MRKPALTPRTTDKIGSSFSQPAHPAFQALLSFAPEANLHQFDFPPKAVITTLRVKRQGTVSKSAA